MNLSPTVHNVVMVAGIAILAILALRLLAKTPVADLPVVGQVVKVGATA